MASRGFYDKPMTTKRELLARIKYLEEEHQKMGSAIRTINMYYDYSDLPYPEVLLKAQDIILRFEELYEHLGLERKTTPEKTGLVKKK